MGHRLQNGDQVGVQDYKNQKPNGEAIEAGGDRKRPVHIRTALREDAR